MLKILNLLPRVPTPTVDGGAIAVFFNLLNLKRQGMDVVIAAFESNRHPQHLEETALEFPLYSVPGDFREYDPVSAFKNVFDTRPYNLALRFDSPRFAGLLDKVHEAHPHFDVVQCDWVYMAPYASKIRSLWPDASLVLRQHNAEYMIFRRMSEHETSLKNRLFLKWQAHKMKRYETKALTWFDHVITLTDVDRELFSEMSGYKSEAPPDFNAISGNRESADKVTPGPHETGNDQPAISGPTALSNRSVATDVGSSTIPITTLPVGVDLERFARNPNLPRNKTFLILGSMSWAPYVQALIWFLNHVWQDFHQAAPEWKLRIVGSNPPKEIKDFDGHFNVEVTGFVEDIIPELHSASAMIVPLRSGSGMRVKIIEAMGAGLPVITTSVGCEGIPIRDGHDCLIADTAEGLRDTLIRFTEREDGGKHLSDNALNIAREQFSWDVISKRTVELYKSLTAFHKR